MVDEVWGEWNKRVVDVIKFWNLVGGNYNNYLFDFKKDFFFFVFI